MVGDLHGFTSADLCRKFAEYPKMVTHTTAICRLTLPVAGEGGVCG